ncbi:glial cell line-derived neurotrophic factor-like, partial [Centroberyx affinis]|uniref:glial cell line-derived neurotrophic factor-like n=1 Tax=Centroberyx affinis TaxID=166261 RepID=UPI003A5BE213
MSVFIAVVIFGTVLCCFLSRSPVTTTTKHRLLPSWKLMSSSSSAAVSSLSSPSSSSPVMLSGRRRGRSTAGLSSILSEFMQMFQSFTEEEIKNLIDKLITKKLRREGSLIGRRPKRAGGRGQTKVHRQCALREEQLTVSDLGLGYLSDETISFHYCSGSCRQQRRNYDLIMKKWRKE